MSTQVDLEYLKEISDGDDEFLRDLLESFVNQTPEMVTGLIRFIKEEDWESAAKRAHKLKPTFEYVGLIAIRDNMEFIEKTIKNDGDISKIQGMTLAMKPEIESAIDEVKSILQTL